MLSSSIYKKDNGQNKKILYHFQRFEFKYHIPERIADAIIADLLDNHMMRDPFAGDKKDYYMVTSLYFDSPTLKCYNEKISGIKYRSKLRLRAYDDNSDNPEKIFLEIKRKLDAIVIKDRAVLNNGYYKNILNGERPDIGEKNETLEEFLLKQKMYSMEPVVLVKYKRKPLISKFDKNLRVTLDYNIEAGAARNFENHENMNPVFKNYAVLEIKYNNSLPAWLHKIIEKHNFDREPFSKYCRGIDTIRENHQLKY